MSFITNNVKKMRSSANPVNYDAFDVIDPLEEAVDGAKLLGHDVAPIESHLPDTMQIAALYHWVRGDENYSPFQQKAIKEIYKKCQTLRSDFSLHKLIDIISLTTLTLEKFLMFIEFITRSDIVFVNRKIIYKLTRLTRACIDIFNYISRYNLTNGSANKRELTWKIISKTFKATLYILQIATLTILTKNPIWAKFVLSISSYLTSLYQLFQSKYGEKQRFAKDPENYTPHIVTFV